VCVVLEPGEFPGLLPLIQRYLDSVDDCDVDTSCTILQYLKLIRLRASGANIHIVTLVNCCLIERISSKLHRVLSVWLSCNFVSKWSPALMWLSRETDRLICVRVISASVRIF